MTQGSPLLIWLLLTCLIWVLSSNYHGSPDFFLSFIAILKWYDSVCKMIVVTCISYEVCLLASRQTWQLWGVGQILERESPPFIFAGTRCLTVCSPSGKFLDLAMTMGSNSWNYKLWKGWVWAASVLIQRHSWLCQIRSFKLGERGSSVCG